LRRISVAPASPAAAFRDQVHTAVADMRNDQVNQLAGQDQRGVVALAGDPQAGQDRQADRPAQERRVADDADHHPAVTRRVVVAGATSVMMPGGAMELAAYAAP
jgi:hypothetical protein